MEKERMMSAKEVSETLNISRNTVLRWVTEGRIKGVKFGRQWRFRSSNVEKWLEEGIGQGEAWNDEEHPKKGRFSLQGIFKGGGPIPEEDIDEVIEEFNQIGSQE